MNRPKILVAVFVAAFASPAAVAGMFTTPGGVCTKAGFVGGEHDECARRVQRERRAAFWNEGSAGLLLGPIGGLIDSARYGTQPGIRRIDVDGAGFYVRVQDSTEATVRSVVRYKNIKGDEAIWRRAGELATGCLIARAARDLDTLYLWLQCAQSEAQTARTEADQAVAPTQSVADEISKLAALRDKGILTEGEFQEQKVALLKRQRQ